MDPADVPQDAVEDIAAIVSRPIQEVGPPSPQQIVTGWLSKFQQQEIERLFPQEEGGPHCPEQLCMTVYTLPSIDIGSYITLLMLLPSL